MCLRLAALRGRLAACGRFLIGLCHISSSRGRRIGNPPQIENLPHKAAEPQADGFLLGPVGGCLDPAL